MLGEILPINEANTVGCVLNYVPLCSFQRQDQGLTSGTGGGIWKQNFCRDNKVKTRPCQIRVSPNPMAYETRKIMNTPPVKNSI